MKISALFLLVLFSTGFSIATPVERPNIVFLLSDDQDWTGLSVQMHPDLPNSKSDFYRTPHLEKFAAQGMRFSAAYSPAPVCSPTRISLQTGMSPAKLGWTKAAPAEEGHKLIEGANRKSIRPEETTVAEMLKTEGYATAHYGKWHLSGGGPEAHGYDESDGDTGNRDADAHVDPNPVDIFGMTDRASAFMEKQSRAGKPFYVQMSYFALHLPENALKATRAFYDSQPPGKMHSDPARAAITTDLDTGVGRLLESIDRLGLTGKTYVIYMSDNGAGGGKGNGRPLTAGKGGVWEGGIRVPLIVRGPGIEANSWCHQRVVGYDFFPTLCRWAGVTKPLPAGIEGGDLTPLIFEGSREPVKRPHEELVFHFPHYQGDTPHSAIYLGRHKLLHFYETGETQLFDLDADLGETRDLSRSQPEVAADLKRRLDAYLAEVGASMPKMNPTYDPAKEPAGKGGGGGKGGKGGGKGGMKGKGGGGKGGAAMAPEGDEDAPAPAPAVAQNNSVVPPAPTTPEMKKGSYFEIGQEIDRRLREQEAADTADPKPVSPPEPPAPPPMTEPRKGGGGGGGPRSVLLTAIDTDGDREISDAEMREAGRRLLVLDRNQSGQLESEELAAASIGPTSMPAPQPASPEPVAPENWLAANIDALDLNGDGGIDRAELMNQARLAFGAFDSNADGVLKREEYAGRQPKSPMAAYLTGKVAGIDADGNGLLTANEFAAALTKELAAADRDGDGKAAAAESAPVEAGHVGPASRRSAETPGAGPGIDRQDAGSTLPGPTRSGSKPPNVVLFLIDDMGWRDVGFAGNPHIDTPNCDRLAREGTVFTQAYSSAPNCAPTRACLMSGQYTPRHGVYTVVDERHAPGSLHHKVLSTESRAELPTESVTIAESFRAGGYATGMIGMWNLGRGNSGPFTPIGQGFEVFKEPKSLGFEKDAYQRADGAYLSDEFTRAGIEWMDSNRDRPFFLYMAYHDVHAPYDPKPELAEKYRKKAAELGVEIDADHAATVEALDQNVGRILDYLDEQGLTENTIVLFTSDNGGTRQYTAPLNAGKGSLYEGGIRVPLAIRGPGVRAGHSSAEPVLTMDFYPTLLDFAGLSRPKNHILDGESLASLLTGKTEKLPRDRAFWHFPCYIGGGGPSSAMRKGDWKIIEFFETQTVEVFNLAKDPGERNDLSGSMPEKARELAADLHAWQTEVDAPRPTEANPNHDPSAQPNRGKGKGKGGMAQ
ncbi:MAG: sulfatase-like hydrolase/transferase [Verrucomicrobiales bacterium]|nr:sulfatase-like hydrolase/transferase [Verrucomicrobiales bacterium]